MLDPTLKWCAACKTYRPLDAFKTRRMRLCVACQEANIARKMLDQGPAPQHRLQTYDGQSPYATWDGMLAMQRLRRRQAKMAAQAAAAPKFGRPPMPRADDPPPIMPEKNWRLKWRKCRTCGLLKRQHNYPPRSYTCTACDDAAFAGTRPAKRKINDG